MNQRYLTLAAIVRDQEHYVKEWLTFYHLVGVERFVIVLHKCSDKTEEKIRELPFQEKIHIHRVVNGEQYAQLGAYLWILDNYGKFTRWMMFVDSDEFCFGTKEDDLKTILADYEQHGGLLAHWYQFGSNNHTLKPQGLSIEALTTRAHDRHNAHRSFKTILQPRCFLKFRSPHLADTNPLTVTEDHKEVKPYWYWMGDRKPTWNVIRVNHYHVRSMEDWVERYHRGQCNDPRPPYEYGSQSFKDRDNNDVTDHAILRFAGKLRESLSLSSTRNNVHVVTQRPIE